MRVISKINLRIVLILTSWISCATAVWFLLTPRPFVIDNVTRYWASDDGSWLATCTQETEDANAKVTIWDLRLSRKHYEFELDSLEFGWIPQRVVFAPSGKVARVDGVLLDLVEKSHMPHKVGHPEFEHLPFD